jgi:hypothetical protein
MLNNKELLEKIIKHYQLAQKNLNNINKQFYHLEKTLNYLSKINSNKKYIREIKFNTFKMIDKLIDNELIKNDNQIDFNIFDSIDQGDLSSLSESDQHTNFNIYDSEGNTPLHRCVKNGDATILKELLKRGENVDTVNKSGHTLLEYACLLKDPNMINLLCEFGADMKKHLYFREKNKDSIIKVNDIDIAILIKKILMSKNKSNIDISFLNDYIKPDTYVGLGNVKFKHFCIYLANFLSNLSLNKQNTIIEIWKEELNYKLNNNLGCPDNYIEIILINLIPFINYEFNLSNRNYLTLELIFMMKNIIHKNNYLFDEKFNNNIINKIWIDYKHLPIDYLGTIISHIMLKINKLSNKNI